VFFEESITDGLNHSAILILKAFDVDYEPLSGFFDFLELDVLLARDEAFDFHVDFSNMCGSGQLERFKQVIDVNLILHEFFPDLLGAVSSWSHFAFQKIHIKVEELPPLCFGLVDVHSDLGRFL
jgi:hypothetical protein